MVTFYIFIKSLNGVVLFGGCSYQSSYGICEYSLMRLAKSVIILYAKHLKLAKSDMCKIITNRIIIVYSMLKLCNKSTDKIMVSF